MSLIAGNFYLNNHLRFLVCSPALVSNDKEQKEDLSTEVFRACFVFFSIST